MKKFITPVRQDKAEKKKYRWQVAITTLVLFIFSAIINIPFSREVKRLGLEMGRTDVNLSDSISDDLLAVVTSSSVLGAILLFTGLRLSSGANLGVPILARIFSEKKVGELISWKSIFSSLLLAAFVALLLLGLFEIQQEFYPIEGKMSRPGKLYYALVSFSAGISEEIIFRLGLMSFIIAVILFFTNRDGPSNKMIWTGIFISALFFGLLHLPLSKNFVELIPFTVAVTLIGNFITGSLFGWIFWKQGLLVAILSHIVFDLVFHVLGSPYA